MRIPLSLIFPPVLIIYAARQMEVVSGCGFDLHFPEGCDVGCLYILIGPLYTFFGEMPVKIVYPFENTGLSFINEL